MVMPYHFILFYFILFYFCDNHPTPSLTKEGGDGFRPRPLTKEGGDEFKPRPAYLLIFIYFL
jgi:hypothetical protein